MKITPSFEPNTLVICGLCEQPTPLTYVIEKETKKENKKLCLCGNCIMELSEEIIDRYKKNLEKSQCNN